jgi:hypothetical protein
VVVVVFLWLLLVFQSGLFQGKLVAGTKGLALVAASHSADHIQQ